jgi:hypothetical protein
MTIAAAEIYETTDGSMLADIEIMNSGNFSSSAY